MGFKGKARRGDASWGAGLLQPAWSPTCSTPHPQHPLHVVPPFPYTCNDPKSLLSRASLPRRYLPLRTHQHSLGPESLLPFGRQNKELV